jgi:predicted transcriptional regulator
MTKIGVNTFDNFMGKAIAIAKGEDVPNCDVKIHFESIDGIFRLLNPENRNLLKLIRDKKPKSISDLAILSNRAESNLLRTLLKFEAIGFIEFEQDGRRKIPKVKIDKFTIEVDPFETNDKLVA